MHGKRNFTFARLFQTFEAIFEELHLFDVENFDSHHPVVVLAVLGDVEMRHGSGDSCPLPCKTAFHIDPARSTRPGRLKCRFKRVKQAHQSQGAGVRW